MTKFKIGIVVSFLMFQSFTSQAFACSRVIYEGADSRFITARSMDWKRRHSNFSLGFPKRNE